MEDKDAIHLLPLDRETSDQISRDRFGFNERAHQSALTASYKVKAPHTANFHRLPQHVLELQSAPDGKDGWGGSLASEGKGQHWEGATCPNRKATAVVIVVLATLLLALGIGIGVGLQHGGHRKNLGAPDGSTRGDQYRSAFHFQPAENWMNDPNGPVFYKGFYHLFFQFNDRAAVWGNITWGHAISTDLVHWMIGPIALRPDEPYDAQGVWSGSATLLQDGSIVLAYTGFTDQQVQVQNLALPANASDPLLLEWTKSPRNPIIQPPPGVNGLDFRDPTTAWLGEDGLWRMLVGARVAGSGAALMYTSSDFQSWSKTEQPLHSVPGSPMWECPDLYPVAQNSGLPLGDYGPGTLYVLKASIDHTLGDSYALGLYDSATGTWAAVGEADVSRGRLHDYGKYYASKSFFDPVKNRRVLFGWIYETDSQQSNIKRGWASVQALPRSIFLDVDGADIVQWPIAEVEALRHSPVSVASLQLGPGSQVDVHGASGCQLDLELEFALPPLDSMATADLPATNVSQCDPRGAVRQSGAVGPFGVAFLALGAEVTAAYLELAWTGAAWTTRVCSDLSRASLAPDTDRGVYGSTVKVDANETTLTMRVLVDHSVAEVFAQRGRTAVTTRSYPVHAMSDEARVFLFNNGSSAVTLLTMTAWHMSSIEITSVA